MQLLLDTGLVAWGASYDQRGLEDSASVHQMPDDFFFEHVTPTILDPTEGAPIAEGLLAVRADFGDGEHVTVVAERDGENEVRASLRSGHTFLCDHAMPRSGQAAELGRVWEARTVIPGWAVYTFFKPRKRLHSNAFPGKVSRACACITTYGI